MHSLRRVVVAVTLGSLTFLGSTRLDAKETPGTALDMARLLNEAFVELAERVSPSVVVISVVQKPEAEVAGSGGHPFLEMFPEEWREELEKRFKNNERRGNRRPQPSGRGSGVVLREDGYILTNNHVVEEAETIKVRLRDGREFKAEVTGLDEKSDLAVIKLVEPPKDLRVAKLADSAKVRVGEFAVAIGAPFELDYSLTFGHVSAIGRGNVVPYYLGGNMMDQDFIQTDANINPGNSGGPLVNIEGEVIGINSIIRGMGTGIGFAVPSNLAREVSEQLIAHGKFTRSWLGIGINALRENRDYAEMFGELKEGVIVESKRSDGPAAKSELKTGDVITAVDGKQVKDPTELRALISRKTPGENVTLDVSRLDKGSKVKSLKIKVRPEAWPDQLAQVGPSLRQAPKEAETMFLGIKVKPMSKDTAKEYGVELTEGVIVTEVEPDSLAAERGLQPGDVITEINHEQVSSPKEFRAALKEASLKNGILLNYTRKGEGGFTVLKEKAE